MNQNNSFEKYYKTILDNTNDVIFIFNKILDCIYTNELVLKDVLGYTLAEIQLKEDFFKIVSPEEQKKIFDFFENVFKKGTGLIELKLKHKKGNEIVFQVKANSFIDDIEDKKIIFCCKDITAQKNVINELMVNKEQYKNLYGTTLAGLWSLRIKDGIFTNLNLTTAKILGFEKIEDVINKLSAIEFFKIEDRSKFIRVIHKNIRISDFEIELTDINGFKKEISISARIHPDKGIIEGLLIDISNMKKIQRALIENQDMLQQVMNNISQYIFWKDKNSIYLGCNKNFAKVVGLSDPNQIIGKTDNDLHWSGEQSDSFQQMDNRVMVNNIPEIHVKEKYRNKTGKEIILDTNKIPFHDSEGNVAGIIGAYEDITNKVKNEQKLTESEEKFRTITEQALMGIFILQDEYVKYINEYMAELIGYSVDEIIKWNKAEYINRIHPKDRDFVVSQAKKKQKGDMDVITHYQFRLIKKNGDTIWVDNFSKTINLNGRPADLATMVDITERKYVENALLNAEREKSVILESISDHIIFYDKNFNIVWANKSAADSLNMKIDDLKGHKCYEFWHNRNEPCEGCPVLNSLNTHEVSINEMATPDGKIWRVKGYPVRDEDNNIIGVVEYTKDVTEIKRAEQDLKESEEKFRLISKNANDLIAVLNQELKFEYINEDVHFELMGYSEDDALDNSISDIIHPDDYLKAANFLNKIFIEGKGSLEVRVRNKMGNYKWLECKGKTFLENNNKKIVLISRDITERRISEHKLKESEEKYRILFDTSVDGIAASDIDGNVLDSNQAFLDMLGYSLEEFKKLNFIDITPSKWHELEIERVRALQQSGEGSFELEKEYICKDGTIIPVNVKYWINKNEKGVIKRVWAIIRNISERKKMVDKLKKSEERYRTMINDLDLGFYSIKWDGKVLNVNPAFKKIMGYNISEDLKSFDNFDFWKNEEDRKRFFKTLLKKNIIEDYIVRAQNRYNQEIFLEIHSHLIKDDYGVPLKFEGTIANITEKYKLEQKLKHSELRYRNLFENSNFAIILLDTKSIIRDCNPVTEEIIGYEHRELIGRSFENLSITHPEDLPILLSRLKLFVEGKKIPPIEVRMYKKDGTQIWAHLISNSVKIGEETFIQVMGHDITERKKAELLIKEEIQKLKELDQIRKDLISRVSHELKTPLIPVIGGAELLQQLYKDKFDKEPLELLEMIEKGGKRLSKLVERLLDVTRIQYDKFELDKEELDLSKIIKDASSDLKYLFEKRKIQFNLVIPDKFPIELDPNRIEQVVTNLLSNAIKNTPPEGRISLVLEKIDNWAIISVSDTGVGFTEEEMKKLFTRFGKIERYEEGLEYVNIEGSGLGLYITKQIVDLHNGKIWVESTGRNKGCIFKVRLPI